MPSLSTQIENAPYVEKLIREALDRIRMDIVKNMSDRNRNASKHSIRSLKIETNSVEGTLSGSRSFIWMESGRGSGKVPARFQDIIAQWIVDKGITVTTRGGIRSAAYLIARSIRNNGTSLFRKGGKDDIYTSSIDKHTNLLGDKILLTVDSDISSILTRFGNPSNQ